MFVSLQLSLRGNPICGITRRQGGHYVARGIDALAEALRVNIVLTTLDLRYVQLGTEREARLKDAANRRKEQNGIDLKLMLADVTSTFMG